VEEITLDEDEPFFSEFPADWELKVMPIRRWLDAYFSDTSQDILRLYEQAYERMLLESRTPEGAFALSDKKEIAKDVMTRLHTLEPLADRMKSGIESDCLYRCVFIGSQNGQDNDFSRRNSGAQSSNSRTTALDMEKRRKRMECHDSDRFCQKSE